LQRGFFIGEFRENLVEMSDLQYLLYISRQSDNLHLAAAFKNHYIDPRQLADSGTVDILQSAEVKNEVFVTFTEKTRDVFAENADFEEGEAASKLDQRGARRMPDGGGKVQYALPRAGTGNSTVPGEFRTGYSAGANRHEKTRRASMGRERGLLAHDDAEAAAPTLCQADAGAFYLGRKIAKESVRRRMKAERWSNQVDEGRSSLQFDSGKISVACEISLIEMVIDMKPIARGLQREMNVLAGF
jgi:hypothetical protein